MSMQSGGVNTSVPISTQDRTDTSAGSGSTWGGFGGTWTVNQKGSGVKPVWLAVALAVGMGFAYLITKRKG